jgi:hypothetical protein
VLPQQPPPPPTTTLPPPPPPPHIELLTLSPSHRLYRNCNFIPKRQ